MSSLGKKLIKAAKEGAAIARSMGASKRVVKSITKLYGPKVAVTKTVLEKRLKTRKKP